MDTLLQDLRFALRTLLKTPRFTAVVVLCLALAIGANTAIFSIVNAVLLRPFPYADPDRIIALFNTQPHGETQRTGFSYLNYLDLKQQNRVFSELAAFKERSLTFTGLEEPERLAGQAISASLFPLLGVQPFLGRNFREEDDRPGAPGVVLLGYDFWTRRFSSDRGVVGRSILVDGAPHVVVGVMPPRFKFPYQEEAWVPLAPLVGEDPRTYRDLQVLARLKPGVSLEQARTEVETIARRLESEYPDSNAGWSIGALPLREDMAGDRLPKIVLSAMAAVVFVLLIACVNLANLLLARATSRHQEMAVRAAFGAGRGRVVRQLLTESVLLALMGGALGILLAAWGVDLIAAAIPQESSLPYWIELRIDLPVLLFTLAVALLTGIAFGLAPALQVSRTDLNRILKEGGRGSAGGLGGNRLRGTLVVVEIALSLVLLVGASLFVRSFLKLLNASGGFETERILTLRTTLPKDTYAQDELVVQRVDDIVRRLEGLPGVEAVGASNTIPLSGGCSRRIIFVEGQTFPAGEEPTIFYTGVTPHFFRALGVPVIAGRGFTERESTEKSDVALVNQKLAKRFWSDGSAVGRRFRLKIEEEPRWITIVGIVPDIKNDDVDQEVSSSAYVPFPNLPSTYTGLLIRTRLDTMQAAAMVRKEIHASDPNLPIFEVAAMEAVRQKSFWEYRLFGGLFTVFSGIALFLAALGIYGVLSYAIHQRQREIGVRVALGAQQGEVIRLFLKQGLRLALAGVLIGLLGAFGASRLMASLLYEVSSSDPVTFVGIALLLALVALLASYLPARRAMAINPLEVLRTE